MPCALQYPTPLLTRCQQHPSSDNSQKCLQVLSNVPPNHSELRITVVDILTYQSHICLETQTVLFLSIGELLICGSLLIKYLPLSDSVLLLNVIFNF